MLHGEAFYIEVENADSTVVLSAFLFFEFNRSFVFCTYMSTKMCNIAYQTWGKMQETAAWMRAFFIIPFARLCMPGKGNAAGKCLPACDLLMGASLYSNNSFRRMQRCGGLYGVSIREELKEGKRITLRRETGPGSIRRTWRWNKVFEQDDRTGKEK